MIDFHSHLLPSIDDGVKTYDESLEILENYAKVGITDIVLTPHYVPETPYNSPKIENQKLLQGLKNRIASAKTRAISRGEPEPKFPNLYLGNEIYIDPGIRNLLTANKISSINNTKYLLIELPMSGHFENYRLIFRELIKLGYHVILAHPERYRSFQNDFEKLEDLRSAGILFQSNLGSILGQYGNSAKKVVKKLAKNKMIFCFGTDIHHPRDYSEIEKAQQKLRKYYSDTELEKVLSSNAAQIIQSTGRQ